MNNEYFNDLLPGDLIRLFDDEVRIEGEYHRLCRDKKRSEDGVVLMIIGIEGTENLPYCRVHCVFGDVVCHIYNSSDWIKEIVSRS